MNTINMNWDDLDIHSKKVGVAMRANTLIETGSLIPIKNAFIDVRTFEDYDDDDDLREIFMQQRIMRVPAGALYILIVALSTIEGMKVREFDRLSRKFKWVYDANSPRQTKRGEGREWMMRYFPDEELSIIESVFDVTPYMAMDAGVDSAKANTASKLYSKLDNATERMRAITKNLIDNAGNFIM